MFPKPISSLGMEKLNQTQRKHTITNQNKCTTQNKHKKTKARFSRLLRHRAWKRSGPVLVSVLHKICHSLTYLDTYPLTAPGPMRGSRCKKPSNYECGHPPTTPPCPDLSHLTRSLHSPYAQVICGCFPNITTNYKAT